MGCFVVVLPAYKPDERMISIVERLKELGNQVIVVDDGSGEGYLQVFERIKNDCTLLRHKENLGKGMAIKTALRFIDSGLKDADVVGIMDSDGQHLPEDMQKLLEYAKIHGNALVLGVRSVKDMPSRSRLGNTVTRGVFHMISGVRVSDTQTGLRAFQRSLLKEMLSVSGERYEYEMNVLMEFARKGIPIEEVMIETIYINDNAGSHFNVVKDSIRIYKNILKFAFSSFSSFLLDYLLFMVFIKVLPIKYMADAVIAANVLARIISSFYNYSVNCRFVFQTEKKINTAAGYFSLAIVILMLNSLILSLFVEKIHLSAYPAKLLTEGILFIFSWLVQNFVIFKNKK